MIYMSSLITLHAISLYWNEAAAAEAGADLDKYFPDLTTTMITLFQAISGGIDWAIVLDPLMRVSPWIAVPFIFYIVFCQFALMNVVTGVFVESAMISTTKERERQLLNTVRDLFMASEVRP